MSTEHCEHDVVVSDSMGEYRCWRCRPVTGREFEDLQDEVQRLRDEIWDLKEELRRANPKSVFEAVT